MLRADWLPDGTPVRGCMVVAEDRHVRRADDYERFIDAVTFEDGRALANARGPKDLHSETWSRRARLIRRPSDVAYLRGTEHARR
ncbi:hypothetical protein ACTWPT_58755 [Nonomuraea sp. 3N208]|uniref:hypothetical protein n=1 Tax=Nonomuraea sp. 3N208 TaxID=3457421 RepID=UPI003FD56DD8